MATPTTDLTPMQRQYRAMKEKHQDCILFFRLGDFYEMFNEDAFLAARELDLTLTTRDRGKPKEEQTPMCGVPFHSVDSYIARLVQKGYKVAICEQMEDPATAKGLVERDITRIVTPGTVTESCMLDESKNNYMGCIYGEGGKFGLAFCDVSTGAFFVTVCTDPRTLPRSWAGSPPPRSCASVRGRTVRQFRMLCSAASAAVWTRAPRTSFRRKAVKAAFPITLAWI